MWMTGGVVPPSERYQEAVSFGEDLKEEIVCQGVAGGLGVQNVGIGRSYLPQKDLLVQQSRTCQVPGALAARRRALIEGHNVTIGRHQGTA